MFKLGAAYGKVLASLRDKSGAKSVQIGLDIDVAEIGRASCRERV